ncbi:anti-sigma factor [Demequina sp.]|uniref:anti-sigma factor family protein n=1 Tax=Demequina sp. TaxID=2050685 RepID=UPI0025F71A86|nr:zf-HC2 domain-containing protein [Demequina sp.]
MTARHLGERIHDLLDNRLSRPAAAEAMAHLSECPECTERWRELRAAREALNSSEAGIDMTFARRLLDRERMAQMAEQENPRSARAARGRDRRPVILTLSVTLVLVAVLGAAYVAGAPAEVDPELSASSEDGMLSVVQLDSQSMRSGDELNAWIHPDWQASGFVPVEAVVREASDGSPVLVARLLSGSQPVLVLEQQGRLNSAYVADAPLAEVEGIDAFVVSTSPASVVWQAGEIVVSLTCTCAVGTLEDVAAAFPQDGEPGFVDRIMSGMGVFADALTGN